MLDKLNDKELAELAQTGNTEAFTALYQKYSKKLQNLIYRLTNGVEAEEVMQEVAFQAFRSIRNFRGDSAFYTWIYRIATNISFQYLKKNRRGRSNCEFKEELLVGVSSGRPSVEHEVEGRTLVSAVMREIDKLPPQQRTVIVMAGIQGMSYQDMALFLGVSEEVIKGRLHRARESIRSQLHSWK